MELTQVLLLAVGAFVLGGLISFVLVRPKAKRIEQLARRNAERATKHAEQEADRMMNDVRRQTEQIRKQSLKETEESQRRLDKMTQQAEERLARREETLENKIEKTEKAREDYEQMASEFEKKKKELDAQMGKQAEELAKIAKLKPAEAKEQLLKQVEKEIEPQLMETKKRKFEAMESAVDEEAANILVQAIQRFASATTAENTTTSVPLKSDDEKGKIIGREGRNINAFEMIAGVDVIIDDTPNAITISSYDMFRRYVAKIAMEELLKDGRINPANIENAVEKAQQSADKLILDLGKRAQEELELTGLSDEVLKLVGRLRFRTSYGQNVLTHSVEVAWLADLIAQQIPGADPMTCRKAGLVHDIGKAVSHEVEGGHALIGRDILNKFGVSKEIVQAMESHHEDVPYATIESRIVQAADAISASRPGARRETLEKYIKRLKELEGIAGSFKGVDKAYALQAGREIRVFVNAQEMDDAATKNLSFDMARKIEANCDYPGEVKVTVIRERRYKEVAR